MRSSANRLSRPYPLLPFRLADYALQVINRQNADMKRLRTFDASFDAFGNEFAEIERNAHAFTMNEGGDLQPNPAENGEPASLIQSMDWTYDMADWPS